jgi:aspartate/methionine/tyrosine aminotransferase
MKTPSARRHSRWRQFKTGGEFVYSEPGYTALVDAVAPGGGVVVGVPLNAHLENDLPAIAARGTARTRAIYIVNPHNPTGTASSVQGFLAEMARATTSSSMRPISNSNLTLPKRPPWS